MVKDRNKYELKLMQRSGQIAASALKAALDSIAVGVSELEVDKVAENTIYKLGGDLSYKTVPNYNFATCVTVNEQVVHGIPTDRKFMEGDLISVDLAVEYKGWHTDCAWTILLGKDKQSLAADATKQSLRSKDLSEKEEFLKIGEKALWEGISNAVEGKRIGDISSAIQERVEGAGFNVVRSLVGHGVGKSLHEDPEIPGYGKRGTGLTLKKGMTLAIEVIYTKGGYEVVLEPDGWTFKTADGSYSAVFEMTVAVGRERAQVLTNWKEN